MTFSSFAQSMQIVSGLVVSVSVEGTTTVVVLRGEGDLTTLPVLVKAFARVIADNQGDVVVDLAETEFLDTASVRVIGRAGEYLRDRGRQLTIRSASREAVMVLAVFGLSHLVETVAFSWIDPSAHVVANGCRPMAAPS